MLSSPAGNVESSRVDKAPGREEAMSDVGQLLDLRATVDRRFLNALLALVENRADAMLGADVADPRLRPGEWASVLARDVIFLLRWATDRLLLVERGRSNGATSSESASANPRRVLSLMPRHGLTLRVLRRAVPFAACGIPVTVAGHAQLRPVLAGVVARLAMTLCLEDRLQCATQPAPEALDRFDRGDDLVVVTGSTITAETIRVRTGARVVASTGRCAMFVHCSQAVPAEAISALATWDDATSCTRFGGAWRGSLDGGPWVAEADAAARPHDAREVLERLHPSIVFTTDLPDDDLSPTRLHGYSVIGCDRRGRAATLVGFGRDPRYGWPGDFVV
jgi:hypothetical protein